MYDFESETLSEPDHGYGRCVAPSRMFMQLTKVLFKAGRNQRHKQPPGRRTDVLIAMRRAPQTADNRPAPGANRSISDEYLKLAIDDQKHFVFQTMNVKRRTAARR